MKIVIAEKYKHLTDFIQQLPLEKYPIDEVIRNHRNTVTKVTVDGGVYIVKKYIRPKFHNRLVYTFLRKSKARRSYEYALELKKRGIGTADPVAYIEIKENGLFHTGFFVSEFIDEPLLEEIEKKPECEQILREFAEFTVNLHQQGVAHYDYNPCNILFRQENGKYKFSMIDINRMSFRKKLSKNECLNCMKRIDFEIPTLTAYVRMYSDIRGWLPELTLGEFYTLRGQFMAKKAMKKKIRERKRSQ